MYYQDEYISNSSDELKDSKNDGQEDNYSYKIRYEVNVPWRRYFARTIDLGLYSLIFTLLSVKLVQVSIREIGSFWMQLLDIIIGLTLMLFIEPLMLSKLGTTPGKWILGLRLRNYFGEKMTYGDAFERTFGVIKSGLGFNIPFYSLYRLYKSYEKCSEGRRLPWDEDCDYVLIDKKPLRIVGFLAIQLGGVMLTILLIFSMALPPNRGALTVEEFAENYNYVGRNYQIGTRTEYLNSEGQYVKAGNSANNGTTIIYDNFDSIKPQFDYQVEDGALKALTITYKVDNERQFSISPLSRLVVAMLAFSKADKEIGLFDLNYDENFIDKVNNLYDTYDFTIANTHITNQVNYKGYLTEYKNTLIPNDSADEHYYELQVRLEKVEN